jgi:hypothetical protein
MIVAQPNDPAHLVLRATYGLLFSSDSGASWDWLCEKPVGYAGAEDPSLVITGSGAVLAGTFRGMARTTDRGCSWMRDPSWPTTVTDMAIRPAAPDRVYAIRCAYDRTSDAGATLFHSALLVSDDAGQHWSLRSELDPSLLLDSVEVASSGPKRLYVSAIRPRGASTTAVVLVSDDDGRTFTERAFPFGTSDRGVYLAAVDPRKADVVYVRTGGPDVNRLAVSQDAGRTFRVVFSTEALQGFALTADGATVYAGGVKSGLSRASTADFHFEKRWPGGIQCLLARDDELWACTPTASGFVVGASRDDGRTFQSKLTLGGMRGPLECDGAGSAATCAADWVALRELVSTGGERDAAVSVAPDASPAPSSPKSGPSGGQARGCGVVGAGGPPGSAGWVALACLAVVASRRRRRLPA